MPRRRPLLLAAGLLSASALTSTLVPASAAEPLSDHLLRPLVGGEAGGFPGAEVALGDVDARGAALAPLAVAEAAVAELGDDVVVSWNQYGTPRTLTRPGGFLATGLSGDAVAAARGFLRSRAGLLGLSPAQVDDLELVYDRPLGDSAGHAVLLRQRAGGLALTEDGLITVGVREGKVASLTSSAVGGALRLNATQPRLSALQGVLAAARDAGVSTLELSDLTVLDGLDDAGFQLVEAAGLAQPQRARLRALPTTSKGLRLVWETAVQDVAGGRALAAASYVDAVTGEVLLRRDAVDTAAAGTQASAAMRSISLAGIGARTQAAPSGGTFTGAYTATACSARLPLTVPAGTASIAVAVAGLNPANDITFEVFRNGKGLGSNDLLSSPEAAAVTVEPVSAATDVFTVEVCPFDGTTTAPFDVVGTYATSSTAAGAGALPGLPNLPVPGTTLFGPPTFRAFGANPVLQAADGSASPDDRQLICGGSPTDSDVLGTKDLTGCDAFTYADSSPLPYDVEATTGLPTFATVGNNAVTTNAQLSTSLTPGPPAVPVSSPTRDYAPAFTDAWNTSSCDPLQTVGRADVEASIVNLFAGHNQTHDFTYQLGLTEQTGAMQTNNFGRGGAEGDPEVGNAQNAAATNPTFTVTNQVTTPAAGLGLAGRNNANQITMQDGVPGITNQYLFEPIVGFGGPCADGGLDASIWLHEYTHAVSNRLVAGPDTGLSGQQAGSMGESWGDLVATEYLQAFGLAGAQRGDPFAVGAYATGDDEKGIRNYNVRPSKTPLNYSSFGYDALGPQVHADGEIWNATQMTVRQALNSKYDARFPSSNAALQRQCALGRTAAGAKTSTFEGCPGNRRWVSYLLDAMVLQANGSPTMLDMRDTMLAADMLRTNGADRATLMSAYASRGMGVGAKAVDAADTDPLPSFAAPTGNADVTFSLVDAATGKAVPGKVFVGDYSARALPVATTLGGKNPDAKASLVAGTYSFVVQAKGYGLQRFSQRLTAGARGQRFALLRNLASSASGAKTTAAGATTPAAFTDDDEGTLGVFDGAPVGGQTIQVDLAGGLNRVTKVAVSALHRPADPEVEGDIGGGRLTGVRAFDLQASKDGGRTFTTVYRSPADFFPSDAPRPLAPDLNLRTVTLPTPVVADTLRMVVRTNACTGGADFQGGKKNAVAEALVGSDCRAVVVNAQRVTVTELQAFGTPTTAAAVARPGAAPAGPVVSGGTLPTTGAPVGLAVLALGLLGAAGFAVRRRSA